MPAVSVVWTPTRRVWKLSLYYVVFKKLEKQLNYIKIKKEREKEKWQERNEVGLFNCMSLLICVRKFHVYYTIAMVKGRLVVEGPLNIFRVLLMLK